MLHPKLIASSLTYTIQFNLRIHFGSSLLCTTHSIHWNLQYHQASSSFLHHLLLQYFCQFIVSITNSYSSSSVMAMKYKYIFFFLHLLSLQIIYALAVSLVKVQQDQLIPSISKDDISRNSISIQARQSLESLSPKRFFDFITDPSLLITILHSLEVAYWTFPFGFLLKPIINFFRVPNRRSLDSSSPFKTTPSSNSLSSFSPSGQIERQQNIRTVRSINHKVNLYHLKLLSSLAKFDSYNDNHRIM